MEFTARLLLRVQWARAASRGNARRRKVVPVPAFLSWIKSKCLSPRIPSHGFQLPSSIFGSFMFLKSPLTIPTIPVSLNLLLGSRLIRRRL